MYEAPEEKAEIRKSREGDTAAARFMTQLVFALIAIVLIALTVKLVLVLFT